MPETTLQPDASTGIDSIIDENAPTTNYGANAQLRVETYSDGDNRDTLLKFDLSSIAQGSTIQEATLQLYFEGQTGGAGGMGTSYLSRILPANAGWTEAGATWNTIDGTNSWAGSAGCETADIDYDHNGGAHALFADDITDIAKYPTGQYNDWDLDAIQFQKLIDIGNYGFKLWSSIRSPSANRNAKYTSSDGTAAQRPKLFVRWLEPSGRLVEYYFDIWNPRAEIKDQKGAIVEPHEVRPDNWWFLGGIEMPSSKAYGDMVPDPRAFYGVSTRFNRGGVDVNTDRSQFAELIISRAAAGN